MIEPTSSATCTPEIDSLSENFRNIFSQAKESGRYKGIHECICGEHSKACNLILPSGHLTNSLALHYLERHRADIPKTEITKIKEILLGQKIGKKLNDLNLSGYDNLDNERATPLDPVQELGIQAPRRTYDVREYQELCLSLEKELKDTAVKIVNKDKRLSIKFKGLTFTAEVTANSEFLLNVYAEGQKGSARLRRETLCNATKVILHTLDQQTHGRFSAHEFSDQINKLEVEADLGL